VGGGEEPNKKGLALKKAIKRREGGNAEAWGEQGFAG